jgi:hypothetical protein
MSWNRSANSSAPAVFARAAALQGGAAAGLVDTRGEVVQAALAASDQVDGLKGANDGEPDAPGPTRNQDSLTCQLKIHASGLSVGWVWRDVLPIARQSCGRVDD